MNERDLQENYGIEEQNEVEVEQNNCDNNDDDVTPTSPTIIIGNTQSRTCNLPPLPVKERKKNLV